MVIYTLKMMSNFKRTDRVGDLIQAELAKLIVQEVKDPRVNLVTITGVEVSRDLSHAKVFFTVHDEKNQLTPTQAGLQKASGFLRARLAENIDLRIIPTLRFCYDDTLTRGKRMDDLLDAL